MGLNPKKVFDLIEDMLKDPDHIPPCYLWGPPGIGKCLDPKTRVMVPGGWKEIASLGHGDSVIGMDADGSIKSCFVTGVHRTMVKNPIVVETSSGVIPGCSAEHRFLSSGWVKAGQLTETSHIIAVERVDNIPTKELKDGMEKSPKTMDSRGKTEAGRTLGVRENLSRDLVGVGQNAGSFIQAKGTPEIQTRHNQQRLALAKGSNPNYLEASTDANRIGVSGRDNRRRRDNNLSSGKSSIVDTTCGVRNQHISEVDKLLIRDNRLDRNNRQEEIQPGELHPNFDKGAESGESAAEYLTVPDYKEGLSRDGSQVYRISNVKIDRLTVLSGGDKLHVGCETQEQRPGAIPEVASCFKKESDGTRFCDITTSFGNYIAEGLVVHNSAQPKAVATKHHIGFVDNRAPLHDPTDYRGIPTVIGDEAVWLPPSELPTPNFCMGCGSVLHSRTMTVIDRKEFSGGKVTGVTCKICGSQDIVWKGIFVLEELSSAPPMTQAACYQLTLDKKCGDYNFPKGWIIMATSNRMEDRAVVYRTSTALLNRFFHVDFEYNTDDWIDWALNEGNIDPNVIGFIKWRGSELLFNFKPESSERAFATPRSWHFASTLIKTISSRIILADCLEGCVGKAATADFIAFLKVQTELPDLNTILNGTSKWVPPQNRMDLKYALVSALASRAAKSQFDNVIKYADNLPEEFSVLTVQMLILRDKLATGTAPSFAAWCSGHQDVILTKRTV
jgi:hypothetical protein